MKTLLTILTCFLCISGIMAQNADGLGISIPQANEQIEALYAQQRILKAAGNVEGLKVNRQEIILAWQAIDPNIAESFKPNQISQGKLLNLKVMDSKPNIIGDNKPQWTDDLLIDANKYDGIDMDTSLDGSIYVVGYENKKRYGLGNDVVSIYKSVDNGASFTYLTGVSGNEDYTKIRLNLIENGIRKYLFVTCSTVNGDLHNYRYNIDGGPLEFTIDMIAGDVKDFDVTVDYEYPEAAQLYAVYTKSNNTLYSARTEGNGSGYNWIDEHSFGYTARECAIAYGMGNTFIAFTGFNSGDLYFVSNTDFNNPLGWGSPVTLTDGTQRESMHISLSAERKEFDNYRALVLASQREAGSMDAFTGTATIVQQGVSFPFDIVDGTGNVRAWDSWCKKDDGNAEIQTAYVENNDGTCFVKNYNDADWEDSESISEIAVNGNYGSIAVAQDANGNAIVAYLPNQVDGLYFNSDRNTAGIDETNLSSFVFFPNPTSSVITLKADSNIENAEIYNLLGQKVLGQKIDSPLSEINLSGLSTGTYVLKVTIGNETGSYKIIKI